ncbi:MAG: DUF3644 domain-containing protein [Clostridiales bacterium]|nr:DUF3644 domain-containing protein [Clostridiales bacterium]MBS5877279.1 DUF3644 domain-containing protein [Clostridiales bacterium]
MKKEDFLYQKMVEKSTEAFVMSIEIYNKPTLKYRVEGFAFFICNAWELMLKAHLLKINGNDSIYYKDKGRTISLNQCLKLIFTNDKAPMRNNLEQIIELRNTSTHFITEEYENIYVPLFQSCVLNFSNKMYEFHNIDITKVIPQNFLNLSVSSEFLTDNEIQSKYTPEIADRLIATHNTLAEKIEHGNNNFAININHNFYITKNKNEATNLIHFDNNAINNATIIKEVKDTNAVYQFTMKTACAEINNRLQKIGINIKVNNYIFTLFNIVYDLKKDKKYCFTHTQTSTPTYTYSIHAVELIFQEVKKCPDSIKSILQEKRSKKISPPQEQRNSKS